MTGISGIVLAAGAGTRMGRPKALVRTPAGEPWLTTATSLLERAGCDPVIAVLGAAADDAIALLPAHGVTAVIAADWHTGIAASLAAGLRAAGGDAALVTLVDLPSLPLSVLERVRDAGAVTTDTLRQAVFDGRPGHPVLVGGAHWADLVADLAGDRGARAWLAAHGVEEIECGDLFDGRDIDYPEDVAGR